MTVPPWPIVPIFQSTLSMRRATHVVFVAFVLQRDISIHALHEESDLEAVKDAGEHRPISIHALHEESDRAFFIWFVGIRISIHALHEESDCPTLHYPARLVDFNPRSP